LAQRLEQARDLARVVGAGAGHEDDDVGLPRQRREMSDAAEARGAISDPSLADDDGARVLGPPRGGVARVVVDDDDAAHQPRRHGREHRADVGGLVARRDDDVDLHQRLHKTASATSMKMSAMTTSSSTCERRWLPRSRKSSSVSWTVRILYSSAR